MAKLGPAGYLSIAVAVVGVLFYLLSVAGVLFSEATPAGDIGVISVTLVFVALGLLGVWAHMAEAKENQ